MAVAEPDIEAIVTAVGGNQVETFSLFKGCIVRKDLKVEPATKGRLAKADAVVWTGFLNESAAIHASLDQPTAAGHRAAWIDVSKGATRTNIPTWPCFGDVDAALMPGDPFFWLNPRNGAVIASNVAVGLGGIRPEERAYFLANADRFEKALDQSIARWKEQLKPLANLRIFSTQCGWQNFSGLGGPKFVVCKGTPGVLPSPNLLIEQVKQMKAQIVIVDPNTPPEYERAFRAETGWKVIDAPSSIQSIPEAKSYSTLFENLVHALVESAGGSAQKIGG